MTAAIGWKDPSRWQGRAAHDAAVGPDGSIFLSDETTLDAIIFKLDPQTGNVTSYKFPAKNGGAASTHGIAVDPDGNIWTNNQSNDNLLMFDPKTEQFAEFLRPQTMPGARNTVAVDQKIHKGIIWSATFQDGAVKLDPITGKSIFQNGALRLDSKTGKYSFYPLITGKDTYGVTVDRDGNGWYTSPASDRVDVANADTGKISEIVFQPTGPESGMEITDVDRKTIRSCIRCRTPPPRSTIARAESERIRMPMSSGSRYTARTKLQKSTFTPIRSRNMRFLTSTAIRTASWSTTSTTCGST